MARYYVGGQCGRNLGFNVGMLMTVLRGDGGNLSLFSKTGRANRDFKATF